MASTKKGIHYPDDYSSIADVPADMQKMAESINKLFEENDTKNEEQDKTIQNNTEDISELQKRNAELEAENTLLKSQIPERTSKW